MSILRLKVVCSRTLQWFAQVFSNTLDAGHPALLDQVVKRPLQNVFKSAALNRLFDFNYLMEESVLCRVAVHHHILNQSHLGQWRTFNHKYKRT